MNQREPESIQHAVEERGVLASGKIEIQQLLATKAAVNSSGRRLFGNEYLEWRRAKIADLLMIESRLAFIKAWLRNFAQREREETSRRRASLPYNEASFESALRLLESLCSMLDGWIAEDALDIHGHELSLIGNTRSFLEREKSQRD